MEKVTFILGAIALFSPLVTNGFKLVLKYFNIALGTTPTLIMSWVTPVLAAFVIHWMGYETGNALGTLVWGILAALSSNKIYDLSKS